MVDVLARVARRGRAAGGDGQLAALAQPEQVARVVGELWRADGPYVVPVLEAVAAAGEKAARKAVFKARSR